MTRLTLKHGEYQYGATATVSPLLHIKSQQPVLNRRLLLTDCAYQS